LASTSAPDVDSSLLETEEGLLTLRTRFAEQFELLRKHFGREWRECTLPQDCELQSDLYRMKQFVVRCTARDARYPDNIDRVLERKITRGELARNDRLVVTTLGQAVEWGVEDPMRRWERLKAQKGTGRVWISVRGVVYDVTGECFPLAG